MPVHLLQLWPVTAQCEADLLLAGGVFLITPGFIDLILEPATICLIY